MPAASVRPRVLLLTSGPLEGQEGADIQLAAAVAETVPGIEFVWFTRWPGRGRPPRVDHGRPVPIACWDGLPHVRQRLQAAAAGTVLGRRVDLVHAVMTIGSGYPLFSHLWPPMLAGRRVLHTVPAVKDPRLLRHCRPLGRTVALSGATAEKLHRAGFGEVRVVPPGVRLDRWPRRPRPAHDLPMVLVTGHHDPDGGADDALAIAARSARAGARFRLVLALRARSGQNETALRAAVHDRAAAAGLTDVDVRGNVDDMPALIASADVLLYVPRSLGGKADIPLTVLEALATGRPVLLSDHPQFSALGDTVMLSRIGDHGGAARLLCRLLEQPTWWNTLAEQGRLAVEQRFQAGRLTTAYTSLYQELLS
ncbi:glycosyltransferase family 4 protein [Streptomyces sp. NPDC005931]|uniref:glycosyltransferase family 4 protein n=1 Tax=Streptomyces sp. NPDC005931 TaxID=3364737 RepID=UPI0036ADAB8A